MELIHMNYYMFLIAISCTFHIIHAYEM